MTANEKTALLSGREILYEDTELPEWDIAEYKQDARLIVILGKRNTGKTVLALNFCFHHRAVYPYALIITATKFNNFWAQYFPEYLIVNEFRPEDINMFFEAQKDRVLQRGVNSRMLIIFDDMAAETALRYSEELTRIAYNVSTLPKHPTAGITEGVSARAFGPTHVSRYSRRVATTTVTVCT